MNTRTAFIRLLLACIFVIVIQLLLVKQGLCAEESSANSPSASDTSVDLEKKIYQLVKDLDYSDQVAKDFVKMINLGNAIFCIKSSPNLRKMSNRKRYHGTNMPKWRKR